MGIMIIYDGYNNPMYNEHIRMSLHCTEQKMVFSLSSN